MYGYYKRQRNAEQAADKYQAPMAVVRGLWSQHSTLGIYRLIVPIRALELRESEEGKAMGVSILYVNRLGEQDPGYQAAQQALSYERDVAWVMQTRHTSRDGAEAILEAQAQEEAEAEAEAREARMRECPFCTNGYRWVRVGLKAEELTKVPCTQCNPQETYQQCTRCTGHGYHWQGGESSGTNVVCEECGGTGNLADEVLVGQEEPEVLVELEDEDTEPQDVRAMLLAAVTAALPQASEGLPAVVECPNCLFQHLEGTECPLCTGNWPEVEAQVRARAWRAEGEHPAIMRMLCRVQGTKLVESWGSTKSVQVPMIRLECPACGRLRKIEAEEVEASLAKGLEYICTGQRQYWQVVGTYHAPSQPAEAPGLSQELPGQSEWDYSKGPQPAPVDGLMAELALAEGLTEEEYQQMMANTAQWAVQLEELRASESSQLPGRPSPDRVPPAMRPVVALAEIARDQEGTGLDYRTQLKGLPTTRRIFHHSGSIDTLVVGLTEWATLQGAGELELHITL
jgi:hypothetical protein